MSQNEIKEALEVLKKGGLIICNTDTIPALACDATNPAAVNRLLDLTRRPKGAGLVMLACDMDMVARYVKNIPPIALEVAEVSATPLTIIYPQGIGLAPGTEASDGSVAIRIPGNDFCTILTRKLNRPIVATIPATGNTKSTVRLCMEEISDEILDNVDWVTKYSDLPDMTCSVSSIISLGEGGEVKIIRK